MPKRREGAVKIGRTRSSALEQSQSTLCPLMCCHGPDPTTTCIGDVRGPGPAGQGDGPARVDSGSAARLATVETTASPSGMSVVTLLWRVTRGRSAPALCQAGEREGTDIQGRCHGCRGRGRGHASVSNASSKAFVVLPVFSSSYVSTHCTADSRTRYVHMLSMICHFSCGPWLGKYLLRRLCDAAKGDLGG